MQPEFMDPRTSLFSEVPSLLTQPARLAGDGRACKHQKCLFSRAHYVQACGSLTGSTSCSRERQEMLAERIVIIVGSVAVIPGGLSAKFCGPHKYRSQDALSKIPLWGVVVMTKAGLENYCLTLQRSPANS